MENPAAAWGKRSKQPGSRMKGQLIFEFIIAALLFFFIIIYVINYLNVNVDIFATSSYQNSLHSDANRIAEVLIHTKGDWSAGVSQAVVGLAQDWQVINSTKIGLLDSLCTSDYGLLLTKLDLEGKGFGSYKLRIKITNATSDILVCGQTPSGEYIGEAKRVALSDNKTYLWIEVFVW